MKIDEVGRNEVVGMRAEGNQRPADRVFARAQMLASPLMITTGVVGAYLADIDIGLPWPCGAVGFLAAGAAGVLFMREDRQRHRPARGLWRSWVGTTRDGLTTVRRMPVLLMLCLLTGVTAFAIMPAWHYWPARLQQMSSEGTWVLGWVWALISLAGMGGNALMPRLVPRFRREHVLAVAWVWRGGMLIMASMSTSFVPTVIAVLVLQAVFGLSEPTLQGWMNEHVGTELRATVLSVRSMAFTLGGGVGLICLGLLARANGITAAWAVSGVLLVLAAPGFFLLASEPPVTVDQPAPAAPAAAP